jgi:3-oxoacyl-[acyl-carrier-protein] synthase-3
MRFKNVAIESLSYALPPHVVSSASIEHTLGPTMNRMGFNPGMIESLTGVRERRWWNAGAQPSQVAAHAGRQALEKAGLGPADIDVLVNGSVSRDFIEPATAALVAGQLGLGRHVLHMDVSNACLGFLNSMIVVANMIELGQIKRGLVVSGEVARPAVSATVQRLQAANATADEFRSNFATLTLGSGASAVVMCRRDLATTSHVLHGAAYASDTRHSRLCLATEHEMRVDPAGLLNHGVDCAISAWQNSLGDIGWSNDDVDEVVLHQVGIAHHTKTFEGCGLPMSKAPMTFSFLGNTGPCSVPITMGLGLDQGRIRAGMQVAMFGVGSGLGSLILGVRW